MVNRHHGLLHIASCFVFDPDGRLLLLQRSRHAFGAGRWSTPAGKCEVGEEALTAVLRETEEETGLMLHQANYLGSHEVHMPHGVVRMDTFRASLTQEPLITINPREHERYQWYSLETLLNEEHLIWGLPTILHDFGFIESFGVDPTLSDGSRVMLLDVHTAPARS